MMTLVCLACVNEPAENSYAYSIYGGETLTPLAFPLREAMFVGKVAEASRDGRSARG